MGEGFYLGVGYFYVEVFVFIEVGEKVRGVIVYVNLELCNYYGRILFCIDVLIVVGVVRVVIGMIDFNFLVVGVGVVKL